MELWDIVKRSTHICNSIDGRAVGKRKWDADLASCTHMPWSRDDLVRLCKNLWKPRPHFPYGLRKREYANALVVLRVILKCIHRLEQRSTVRSIKSDTCPICKDPLTTPIFGCNESGYHLVCIRNHMLVSHSFRDPISRREYTDTELKWCDTMASRRVYQLVNGKYEKIAYMRKDTSLYQLKYDSARIADDREQKLIEENLEIITECIERDVDALKTVLDSDNTIAAPIMTSSLEYHFSILTRQCEDTALSMMVKFIRKYEDTDHSLTDVLRNIQNKINGWAQDTFDDIEMNHGWAQDTFDDIEMNHGSFALNNMFAMELMTGPPGLPRIVDSLFPSPFPLMLDIRMPGGVFELQRLMMNVAAASHLP